MNNDLRSPPPIRIHIPPRTLVALAGASGSGKTTFARRWFAPTEVLSSDAFRSLIADDESDQSATADAFDALYFIAARRLARGKLVVVDATHTQPTARARLREFAAAHGVGVLLIVFDLPLETCLAGNAARPLRQVPPAVVEKQHAALRLARPNLAHEGFHLMVVLETPEAVASAVVQREAAAASPGAVIR
ncbi:MAG: AAA family ATPase [Chloracidobacterium sp.]|nr:AAA family ATPase [Chloracidobacterium sp.]MDW8216102.1 AAA family ATPase [Acidobacteriota bacterium]